MDAQDEHAYTFGSFGIFGVVLGVGMIEMTDYHATLSLPIFNHKIISTV